MSKSEIRTLVAQILRMSPADLSIQAGLGVTVGWDSLAQLEILERLEKASGKSLRPEEMLLAETLEDLVDLFQSPER